MRTGAAGYVTGAVCVFAAWSRRPSIFFSFPFRNAGTSGT